MCVPDGKGECCLHYLEKALYKISRSIWETFDETITLKAQYLRTLFPISNCEIGHYIDIGAQHLGNAVVFGENSKETIALDLEFSKKFLANKKKLGNLTLVIADAANLPFKNQTFSLVTQFSILEHLQNMQSALKEAFRVLSPEGKLLIQIPNRYFLFEQHSGLPLINFIPSKIRKVLLKKLGYQWLLDINIPSIKTITKLIEAVDHRVRIISIRKAAYPQRVIIPSLRKISSLIGKIGFFNIFPYSYCLTIAIS
jgi:ubiquinone/menaquinone biosynthesis C-methylase UbiE